MNKLRHPGSQYISSTGSVGNDHFWKCNYHTGVLSWEVCHLVLLLVSLEPGATKFFCVCSCFLRSTGHLGNFGERQFRLGQQSALEGLIAQATDQSVAHQTCNDQKAAEVQPRMPALSP
ncbi:hypothetical protein ISCGN_000164 [Ixodes scapularis]